MLEVSDHRPGERLLIQWSGPPPHLGHRMTLTATLLPLVLGPLYLLWLGLSYLLSDDPTGTLAAAILVGFAGVVWALVIPVGRFLGRGLAACTRIEADADTGTLSATIYGSKLLWYDRELVCPLDDLRRLRLHLQEDHGGLPFADRGEMRGLPFIGRDAPGTHAFLALDVVGRTPEGAELDETISPFRVAGVESREEALDLLRSLGRVCDIEHHRVAQDDESAFVVTLDPEFEGPEGPS